MDLFDPNEPSTSKGVKRRKYTPKPESDSDSAISDGEEMELFSKSIVDEYRKRRKKAEKPSSGLSAPEKPPRSRLNLKRKFRWIYPNQETTLRKRGKFYYLTDHMTKPRKKKPKNNTVQTPCEPRSRPATKSQKSEIDESNGDAFLANPSYNSDDLFCSEEKRASYELSKKQDLAFYIVDEIALEGLDGITVEAFWKRLHDVFPNHISRAVAERIWKIICGNKHISFYILQEPRDELIVIDRCKYLDIEEGFFVDPFIEFSDIYPWQPKNEDGVRGSCATFDTRKQNNTFRRFSLERALSANGQRLVMVADQDVRNKTLFSEDADPKFELFDLEYCLLERIGRARKHGEITQGVRWGRGPDLIKLSHNKKNLEQNMFVVPQFFSLKCLTANQNRTGTMIHLPRFYNKRKTRSMHVIEQTAGILRERPGNYMELGEFWSIFGRNRACVKVSKNPDFRRFFKTAVVPYRRLYPNSIPREYMCKNKQKERYVKILKLVDPGVNVTAILGGGSPAIEKTTVHDERALSYLSKNCEFIRDIYMYIVSRGKEGATLYEVFRNMQMDYYAVRTAMHKLMAKDVLCSRKVDFGRQQAFRFFPKFLRDPEVQVMPSPRVCEPDEETVNSFIEEYDSILAGANVEMYTGDGEDGKGCDFLPPSEVFSLKVPSDTNCTIFVTDVLDPNEDLRMCDIVNKGRDRLLLAHSNISAFYLNEWDDFLLKRFDFSRTSPFFQSGYGKVVYDFLDTVRLDEAFATDGLIVFGIGSLPANGKIVFRLGETRHFEVAPPVFPHDGATFADAIAKAYLFHAMFSADHDRTKAIPTLCRIFECVQESGGKRRTVRTAERSAAQTVELRVTTSTDMEPYFGGRPVRAFQQIQNGITAEIFESEPPARFVPSGTMYTLAEAVFKPQKYVDRVNHILQLVYRLKVVRNVFDLKTAIREKEKDEDGMVCKKSVTRILTMLVAKGYVKVFKVVLSAADVRKTMTLVTDQSITFEHPYIHSAAEELRMKLSASRPQWCDKKRVLDVKKSAQSPFSTQDVVASIEELKKFTKSEGEIPYRPNQMISRIRYGFSPKYVRLRVLHEFLFYLVKELPRDTAPLSLKEVYELCDGFKIKMRKTDITSMPPVYCHEISWRMFVCPNSHHVNWPQGWALACDVILRFPLSVFLKLHNLRFEVPELEEYLSHPIKRHFPITHLPIHLRSVLLYNRKYVASIYELFTSLCYVGLLQLGPRSYKEKDQIFVYVNDHATLYDTCSSAAGYHKIEEKKYKKLPFSFNSAKDVEVYWSEMWRICINTPLGRRKVMVGSTVTIESCDIKPEMVKTLEAKQPNQAQEYDTGKLPGDRRGAAGLDSSLWSYLKRNWLWLSQSSTRTDRPNQVTGLCQERMERVLPQPVPYDSLTNASATVSAASAAAPSKAKVVPFVVPKKPTKAAKPRSVVHGSQSSRKKIVRTIGAYTTRVRVREYYDNVDKEIMKVMRQSRVDWNEGEDMVLRFFRAALVFLCPNLKKQTIPYNIQRDVMHCVCPASRNKTSRAIQRRLYQLLASDEVMRIMESNVENLLNSEQISKYFTHIRDRHNLNVKLADSQIYVAFVYLVGYIVRHHREMELLLLGYIATVDFFSEPYVALFELVIGNLEAENRRSVYLQPQSNKDITKNSITSVVHSSIGCRQNNAGWAFQLFHVYRKFPDTQIRDTISELRGKQLLTVTKTKQVKGDNWHIPLSFSTVYTNVYKSLTYPRAIFGHAYGKLLAMCGFVESADDKGFVAYNEICTFWTNNRYLFEIPEKGVILNPNIRDHGEVVDELAKRFRLHLQQIHESRKLDGGGGDDDDTPEGQSIKNEAVPIKIEPAASRSLAGDKEDHEKMKNRVTRVIFRVPYLMEGNLDLYYKKMMESRSTLEINNYIFLMITDLKVFSRDNIKDHPDLKDFIDAIEEDIDDWNKLVKNLCRVVFAIQSYRHSEHEESLPSEESVQVAFEEWEKELGFEDEETEEDVRLTAMSQFATGNLSPGMEYCVKMATEGAFPTIEEIREGMMADFDEHEERRIPHITDLTMLLSKEKFPDLDVDEDTAEKWGKHFVFQYPGLHDVTVEDVDAFREYHVTRRLLDTDRMEKVRRDATRPNVIKPPELEQIEDYITVLQADLEELESIMDLIEFIQSKTALGASGQEVKEHFSTSSTLDLCDLLAFLERIHVILRAGVTNIVFVHYEYRSEWSIETFVFTPEEKEIFEYSKKQETKKLKVHIEERLKTSEPLKVQLRPWTFLDGTANEKLFNDWLCTVLSHCCDKPKVCFSSLARTFSFITPVDLFFLLETLEAIGCVEIYTYSHTDNYLSTARASVAERKATFLDNFDDMFVKTSTVAGLSFGSYLGGQSDWL